METKETKKHYRFENGVSTNVVGDMRHQMCNDTIVMDDGRAFFSRLNVTPIAFDASKKHLNRCTTTVNGKTYYWVVNLNNGIAYPEK